MDRAGACRSPRARRPSTPTTMTDRYATRSTGVMIPAPRPGPGPRPHRRERLSASPPSGWRPPERTASAVSGTATRAPPRAWERPRGGQRPSRGPGPLRRRLCLWAGPAVPAEVTWVRSSTPTSFMDPAVAWPNPMCELVGCRGDCCRRCGGNGHGDGSCLALLEDKTHEEPAVLALPHEPSAIGWGASPETTSRPAQRP